MHDETIGEYLDQLAARVPAPGGGAVAALHAAQGAALVEMVANYTTGPRYAEHADTINEILTRAGELRHRALVVAAEDATAFTAVTDAYKLPKDSEQDKAARSAAILTATIGAGRPPADTIGIGIEVLDLASRLLPIGNRNVVSDVAAAADSARAAISTGRVNVEINLAGIKNDEAARAELEAALKDVDAALAEADALIAGVREVIR